MPNYRRTLKALIVGETVFVFSIEELSVWDIFPVAWGWFYLFPAIMIVFPKTTKIWPISTFVFLGDGRRAGYIALGFISLLVGVHFAVTYTALAAQKAAYAEGEFDTVEGDFEGLAINSVAWSNIPTGIAVGGKTYRPPGSLHGIALVDSILEQISPQQRVLLRVQGDVFLFVEKKVEPTPR